jgi:DNA-binding GntR family transcriptional regulator
MPPERETTVSDEPAGLDTSTIVIDRSSPVPLYFQLAQQYEAAIRSGQLPPDSRLDNEVKIAQDLGVSRPTVRSALGYLADRGLVVRLRGQGTIVEREKVQRHVQLTSLFDDLSAADRGPTTRVLRNDIAEASESVASKLEVPLGAPVIRLERVRAADGEPIALMHNFLPAGLAKLTSQLLESNGLYDLLRAAGVRPQSATQSISARNASAAEARLLGESRGAALLTMERIAYDADRRPIEFAQHVYRASRYAYSSRLSAE